MEAIIDILIIIKLLLKMSSLTQFFQARNTSSATGKGIVVNQAITQVFQSKRQQPSLHESQVENKVVKKKKEKMLKPEPIQEEVPQQQPLKQEQPQNLSTAIFVGNVPLSSTHKSIKTFFAPYGTVQKVWFRSIPVQESKIPRKAKHIQKKYKQGADSMNAYVKFKEQSQAKAACQANGSLIEDKNIKVTMCNEIDIDYEKTIFIGNLPHQVKDQDIWDAFNHLGTIKNVRVVRDKYTLNGIGIAYVKFEDKEEMKRAISEMNGKKIGDRPMRIKKAVPKERRDKKIKKLQLKKQNKMKGVSTMRNESEQKGEKTGKGVVSRQQTHKTKAFSNYEKRDMNEKPKWEKTKNIEKPFKQARNARNFQSKRPLDQSNSGERNQFGDILNIKGAKEMKNNKKILL